MTITGNAPNISSSIGFNAYVIGTSRSAIYQVDSLPSRTTAVTFRLVDANNATVRFIDTADVLVVDSLRVDTSDVGGYVTSAQWTVGLDTLNLPLGAKLSVTVEHVGGVPGGSTYLVPLQVLAASMTIFTSEGWGPYVTNNYQRVSNSTTPWNDVPSRSTRFTLEPLPPRTQSVEFQLIREDSIVVDSSIVYSNGSQWLTSAENPWFARNLANRVWEHFLGRGIVEFRKGLHGIEKEIDDASRPDGEVRNSSGGALPGKQDSQQFSAARPPLTDTGEDARVSRSQPGTQT